MDFSIIVNRANDLFDVSLFDHAYFKETRSILEVSAQLFVLHFIEEIKLCLLNYLRTLYQKYLRFQMIISF